MSIEASSQKKESGMVIIFIIALLLMVLTALYALQQLITCYRFAEFQSALRSYAEMDATVEDLLKEKSISSYISKDDKGIKLIGLINRKLKRGDFDKALKYLKPINASDINAKLKIEESIEMLRSSREDIELYTKEWDNLLKTRATEAKEYIKIRQELAGLLAVKLTKDEAPTEFNVVDVIATGPLSFYEKGELVDLPVLNAFEDNMLKKQLVSTLAEAYKASVKKDEKAKSKDPAAQFRHVQVLGRHLSRRNKKTAEALQKLHVKIMDNKANERNARNSIQGVMFLALENNHKPSIPTWVENIYSFIRHHSRKFGYILPPVDLA